MAGRILAVAQQKGGSGKTTLAAHLAVAAASDGRSVVAIDMDPQGSFAAWAVLRAETRATSGEAGAGFDLLSIAGWRIAAEAERAVRDHDLVVIDCPPHAATEAKAAIRAASLVLVPVQPSPLDLWATRPTLELAAGEGVPTLLVLTRVPARGRIAAQIEGRIGALGAPVAAARLGNRTAFAAAMAEGRSAAETEPSSRAAAEIAALWREIAGRLAGG